MGPLVMFELLIDADDTNQHENAETLCTWAIAIVRKELVDEPSYLRAYLH